MVPYERAIKTGSETGVKSDKPFCQGLSLGKTNSENEWCFKIQGKLGVQST